ncbi:serine O-acetyltransferase [Cellulomonas endophytica]|uniref:serine O-acetyltransferase n=1 Tax=Cellulomonas endophytica TaxID=2494735 RepID=UPI0010126C87|nr:serine acetyltransferase [Cellulomonas endophytica]
MTTQAGTAGTGAAGRVPAVTGEQPVPRSVGELVELLREDRRTNSTGPLTPGFHAVALHRVGVWLDAGGGAAVLRGPALRAHKLAWLLVRNVYGIQIPRTVRLGRRVRVAHQHGIVVHPFAAIGDDCVLRQGVSLGAGSGDRATFAQQAPQVGRGVSLGAGCVVVGAVRIGDGATIGPNAVVMTHVPAGATVLAQPPRVVRARTTPEETA